MSDFHDFEPPIFCVRVNPHRASAAASRSIGIHGDAPLTLGNGSGTDFQASQCIPMGSNLTLRLTLDARCVHRFKSFQTQVNLNITLNGFVVVVGTKNCSGKDLFRWKI